MADSNPTLSPVAADLTQLFVDVEILLQPTTPHLQLGTDAWYLLLVTCLTAGPNPEAAGALYHHLVQQPRYRTSGARQALVRRLREALVKAVALLGVCKPLQAACAISAAESPEDKDYTVSRKGWELNAANHARGRAFYNRLYGRNASDTAGLLDGHGDFDVVCEHIVYGFFFGDRQAVDDDLHVEVIVLAAIMSQDLALETRWHLRGIRRLGATQEDVQAIWDAIALVASHFGRALVKVPTVNEVESSV